MPLKIAEFDFSLFIQSLGRSISVEFTGALLLLGAWTLASSRIVRKRPQAKTAAALVSWVLILVIAWIGDASLAPDARRFGLDFLIDVAFALGAWFASIRLLELVWVDVWAKRIAKRAPDRLYLDIAKFFILVIVFWIFLQTTLKVNLSAMLTSSAILTALIGFSMRNTLGAVISGLLIKIERPFEVGEWVKIGEYEGQVAEISLRYTKLEPVDRTQVLIPNNFASGERIVNLNRPRNEMTRRAFFPAPLSVPPIRVKAAGREAARRCELVAKHPEPVVRLIEYRDDRAIYDIRYHPKDPREWVAAQDALLSGVWYQFQNFSVDFPLPRRQVSQECESPVQVDSADLAALSKAELFAGVGDKVLHLVLAASSPREYAPGDRIIAENDGGKTMFVVLSGRAIVRRGGYDLGEIGPGGFFGEMALLADRPRAADVFAASDLKCLEIDREGFSMILKRAPGVSKAVKAVFEKREAELLASTNAAAFENESLFSRFLKLFS